MFFLWQYTIWCLCQQLLLQPASQPTCSPSHGAAEMAAVGRRWRHLQVGGVSHPAAILAPNACCLPMSANFLLSPTKLALTTELGGLWRRRCSCQWSYWQAGLLGVTTHIHISPTEDRCRVGLRTASPCRLGDRLTHLQHRHCSTADRPWPARRDGKLTPISLSTKVHPSLPETRL